MAKLLPLQLEVLPGRFAIHRFDPAEPVPEVVLASPVFNICRTGEELSIVCGEDVALKSPRSEVGWSCIKVIGPLDFSLTGILAHLAGLLAEAGISLFAFSTFDTDYLLVKTPQTRSAVDALKAGGCHFP
jgi:hypothetical protein